MHRSQTATEYLVLLGIVVILSLIVITTLGGIPAIGGEQSHAAVNAAAASQKIGVVDFTHEEGFSVFTLRNNQPNPIEISSVSIDGKNIVGDLVLDVGQQKLVTIYDPFSDWNSAETPLMIQYKDRRNFATYTLNVTVGHDPSEPMDPPIAHWSFDYLGSSNAVDNVGGWNGT